MTQTERSEATRSRLVAEARRFFAEAGYAGTSLDEILAASGVTKGALYHHFDGKRALFRAVFELVEAELAERVMGAALAEPDAVAQLRTGANAFLDACLAPEIVQIVIKDATSVLGWDESRAIAYRHALGLLTASLTQGAADGALVPHPPEALAFALTGALLEAAAYVAAADDRTRARAEMGEVIDRVIDAFAV